MVIMKVPREIVTSNEITQAVYMRDPKEVADEFHNFFVSVGVKASHASKSLIELHNLPPPAETTKAPEIIEPDKFQFHAVSTHKTPGHDKITMSVIKDSLPCILPVLTGIVNRSLLSSVFHQTGKFLKIMRLQTINAQYRYFQLRRRFANEEL